MPIHFISLTDTLLTNRQNNQRTIVPILDYFKALDTLDHYILPQKLDALGMSKLAMSLLKSYIEDRRQCVKYKVAFFRFRLDFVRLSLG